MKIRKAVLLLACAVSWGIAVWFAGRLWAAYPLVSVRSDVPVTGRQLEALRSALRQETHVKHEIRICRYSIFKSK